MYLFEPGDRFTYHHINYWKPDQKEIYTVLILGIHWNTSSKYYEYVMLFTGQGVNHANITYQATIEVDKAYMEEKDEKQPRIILHTTPGSLTHHFKIKYGHAIPGR